MTPSDLLDAVSALLAARWPDRTVYRDPCPDKFERPSFLLLVKQAERSDLNFCLMQWDMELAVILFGETDEYHGASYEVMLADRQSLADLFAAGYIACGDRHPMVGVKLDGQDMNEAYLLLNASWTDVRSDVEPEHSAAENFALSVSTERKDESI